MNKALAKIAALGTSAFLSIALTACTEPNSASAEPFEDISSSSEEGTPNSSEDSKKAESSSSETSKTNKSESSSSTTSSSASKEANSSSSTPVSSEAQQSPSSVLESSSSEESQKLVAPTGSFTDSRDGKTYKLAKVGTQTWMAEDLSYGDSSLYTFENALDVCPEGFHLPSLKELETLVNFVGGAEVAAQKLKSTTGWPNDEQGNWNGTDDYGFNAKPVLTGDGTGTDENFWSSTRNTRDYDTGDFLKLNPHPSSNPKTNNSGYFCSDKVNDPSKLACFANADPSTKLSIRCLSNIEDCGGKTIDNTKQFCQDGIAYDICRGRTYDGTKYECKDNTLYEKSSGKVFKYSWFLLNPEKTYGTIQDERDGQYYKTIEIDGVVWFAENLNYASEGSVCPANDEKYCDVYGRMYTIVQALNGDTIDFNKKQGLCPKGTHLPLSTEYRLLWDKYDFDELFTAYTAYFENDDFYDDFKKLNNASGLGMLENGAYEAQRQSWHNINRLTRNIGSDFDHYHYYRWSGRGIDEYYPGPARNDNDYGAIRCVVD